MSNYFLKKSKLSNISVAITCYIFYFFENSAGFWREFNCKNNCHDVGKGTPCFGFAAKIYMRLISRVVNLVNFH